MSQETPAPHAEGAGDVGSQAQPIYELIEILGREQSLMGGKRTGVVDRMRLEEVESRYPLPKRGQPDTNIAERTISTTLLVLEAAEKVKPQNEVDGAMTAAGIMPDDIDQMSQAELTERLFETGLTEIVLGRLAMEIKVGQAYKQAESLNGYQEIQKLKQETAEFSEANVAALAIIKRLHDKSLIGSVTRGRSESLIRIMLREEKQRRGV